MGRPTLFTPELWAEILQWLEDGHPLTDWCRAEEGRPKPRTVREWAENDAALKREYDKAFDAGMDAIALRARRTIRGKDEAQGGESTGDIFRDRAIVDLELKLLSKWSARYRDKVQQEVSGTLAVSWPLPKPPLES